MKFYARPTTVMHLPDVKWTGLNSLRVLTALTQTLRVLTALTQTNFNGVNFFITRLTQFLFLLFFGSKQRSSSLTAMFKAVCLYVHRLIAL